MWERVTRVHGGPTSLLDWWRTKSRCPLCGLAGQSERESLGTILHFIEEAGFAAGFGRDRPNLPALLAAHEARWAALAAELEEFARKNDYRFATDAVGEEGRVNDG